MQHIISQTVVNNTVGIPQSTNGIMMIFCQAVAVSGTFTLNKPYLLTQPSDATALGISATYDAQNGVAVWQQINYFYNVAGAGKYIWLVGVPLNTAYASYVTEQTFATCIQQTSTVNPANRAKMVGFGYAPPATLNTETSFLPDALALIPALNTVQATLFAAGYPLSFIVDGANMNSTTAPASLPSMATQASPWVSFCITGPDPNGVSGVGAALGRFATISIGHGFGAVADDPIYAANAYLTNSITVPATGTLIIGHIYTVFGVAINDTVTYNSVVYQQGQSFTAVTGFTSYTTNGTGYVADNCTPVSGLNQTSINALGAAQYLFLRTWQDQSGLYWNDGATCEDPTLFLSTQENCRVYNYFASAAAAFVTKLIGSNLAVDPSTGSVAQAYLNTQNEQFSDQYILPISSVDSQGNSVAGTGDITTATMVFTGPNYAATKQLLYTITVIASPILGGAVGVITNAATTS